MHKNYISDSNMLLYELEIYLTSEIIIWAMTDKPDSMGYVFPICDGKIDWNSCKENWALLPNDVTKEADIFARYYHLIIFS